MQKFVNKLPNASSMVALSTISQRLQIAAFSLSKYESHRETQDIVAAA